MKKYMLFTVTFSLIVIASIFFILPQLSTKQYVYGSGDNSATFYSRLSQRTDKPSLQFNHILKRSGHYTAEDWRAVIDATWGEGLPTDKKLEIFDYFWKKVDEEYPSFHNIDVNWDSLRDVFRPEVDAGVSRGRFYAIMCQLSLALHDDHTFLYDMDIATDDLDLGIPLFVTCGHYSLVEKDWRIRDHCHFGAGLSPLPDSSLLVYSVFPNHPLGLQRGDIVLGYDGIPWKQLYKELLKAQLPIAYNSYTGTSKISRTYHMLTSAGENWHLFDTIDILKYGSGDTLHLATHVLQNQKMHFLSTAQMSIADVPFPDVDNGHWVSWGIINETQIGYIYAWNWIGPNEGYHSTGEDFSNAITTLMDEYDIKGLIIDSRTNTGGYCDEYDQGLKILFNIDQYIFDPYERADPNDHFAMKYRHRSNADFEADDQLFDKPIAVLTGPASGSAGDLMPFQMKFHPMSKIFGLPTNTQFGGVSFPNLNYADEWEFVFTVSNYIFKDKPGEYLTHVGCEVDEEVWLTQEDVVNGDDTVVKKALEWINTLSYAHDVKVNLPYIKPSLDTLSITATVENPNQHNLSVLAYIAYYDSVLADSIYLFNDGNHNDGSAADSIWGGLLSPVSEEKYFHVSVKTEDPTSGTVRTIPNVALFTSVGPVVLEDYTIASSDTTPNPGDLFNVRLILKNTGSTGKATNIRTTISSLDTFATITSGFDVVYIDIDPGESVTSHPLRKINIQIEEDCPPNIELQFHIDIYSNSYSIWSDTLIISVLPTKIENYANNIPLIFTLHQNYPNPFNPSTIIRYSTPNSEHVTITVYNTLGQKIETLVDKPMPIGHHQVNYNGHNLPSGVYFYRIETGEYVQMRKMLLVK